MSPPPATAGAGDDGDTGGLLGDVEALDRMLARQRVLVVVGPGGVGKTTLSAALGTRAARRHGRRVVVVTVDPARRLAEALGMANLTTEPILVPVGRGGRMWALMVDMARGWDAVVEATAPDPETVDRLGSNQLYRTLTRRFIQSHDYIALDHLLTLDDDQRHDLVIIDTPPARHAIDLIDAPSRMIEFFDSRLLRWLTVGAGSGIGGAAARPFLAVAERLLGTGFLGDIVEFFTLFSRLRPAFVERSRRVEARLAAADTAYVVVTTADGPTVGGTDDLLEGLSTRGRRPAILLVNRLLPGLELDQVGDDWELVAAPEPDWGRVSDRSLRRAVDALRQRTAAARLPDRATGLPAVAVPLTGGDLTNIGALVALLDPEAAAERRRR